MTDDTAVLDEALERVITAARAHLAAVKAAGGALDDEQVWHSYVTLNNSSYEYDQLLLDIFGEVTPWDTDEIDTARGASVPLTQPGRPLGEQERDSYRAVVSVRQRRDFRVPSVATLLAAAAQAAGRMALGDETRIPETVGEAVLELIRDGDGTLSGLDVPELEPLGGVVTVSETPVALAQSAPGAELAEVFPLGPEEQLVARLDEEPHDVDPDDVDPDDGEPDDVEPDDVEPDDGEPHIEPDGGAVGGQQ